MLTALIPHVWLKDHRGGEEWGLTLLTCGAPPVIYSSLKAVYHKHFPPPSPPLRFHF